MLCEQAVKQQEAAFVPEVEEEDEGQALPGALHALPDQDMRQPLSPQQQQEGLQASMAAEQSAPAHVTAGDAALASQNGAAPAAVAVLEAPSDQAVSAMSKASAVSCLLHI